MDKHLTVLETLKEKSIEPIRWHQLDSFLYLVFKEVTPQLLHEVQKLFEDACMFKAYDCISIDLDKYYVEKKAQVIKEEKKKRVFIQL